MPALRLRWKALDLDPTLGEPHAAWSWVLIRDWDFAGAERELKKAVQLSPSYAEGHHQYSHLLLLLGRFDESLIESKKYLQFDPLSASPIGHLGFHYLYAREYDQAIQLSKESLKVYPNDADTHIQLGDAYYQKRMSREALEEYLEGFRLKATAPDQIAHLREAFAKEGIQGYMRQRIDDLKSNQPISEQDWLNIAALYARLGEKDQAFDWLEKASAVHSGGLVGLKMGLAWDNLRSDPRYTGLLQRVGLPQ